jgi:sec-independent protein translocase protein TatB
MGIGILEILIIGVAALVLLGPERLPEVMRQAARIYVQLRRTSNEFKSAFDHVVREAEADIHKDHVFKLNALIQEIQQKQNELSENPSAIVDVKDETTAKDAAIVSNPPPPRPSDQSHWSQNQTDANPPEHKS